jgi:DNA polymerase III alpha subunit
MPDIDLDFPTDFQPNTLFPKAVTASMVKNNRLSKHPCGVYFQNMPVDYESNLAAIPYDKAPEYGFFKLDFLHLSILDDIQSKSELRKLIATDPQWDILWNPTHTHKLFQLHRQFAVLDTVRPTSVIELADCIALIRPNKKHLITEYCNDKYKTRPKLYRSGTEDKSSFKRSHAIAYALTVVIQLHLISQGKL